MIHEKYLLFRAMNSESELSWEEIQKLADKLVFQVTGNHLSDIETMVLQGASEASEKEERKGKTKTYDEIGEKFGFTSHEAFKLQSMGLVETQSDDWSPSCALYHQYLSSQLRGIV